jgi:signal transduction histidine kinase/CheY-like chemotaxis protein
MGATPRQIRSESYSEIGTVLRRDAGVIILRWSQRAALEQPDARRLHHEALLNHLPALLDALGRSLADSDADDWKYARPAADHGAQRWEVGWSLAEVVRDYQILRLVIHDYLDETLDRPCAPRELMAVDVALDDAITLSVTRYVASRDEHVRQAERQRAEEAQKSQEILREQDRRKDEFLAMLAHEIRNLLAPLRNALGVLHLHQNADPVLAQVGEIAGKQVQLMTRLLDDLLDVTRVAQGKVELRKARVALHDVLGQAALVSGPVLKARGHHFELCLSDGPLCLEADAARLLQVFVNLLNNAAKYTNPGGRVRLTTEAAGREAVVRVTDNGTGITPELLPHVFDLFTQAELSPERTGGGLGIGLTLVKRLVELHGGTITAHSAGAGQGAEFTVRLPLAPAGEEAVAAPAEAGPKAAAGRHVLIIEDNADGRESLAVLLRMLGHRVDVAENGTRGIERALAARPEIALIDLNLPDVDGYQVAQRLRASLGRAILLAALTGSGQPEDRRRTSEVGFDVHLTKPVELDELEQVLKRKE